MGRFRFDHRNRLIATIAISSTFFVAEITTGFYTHSLTLIADAFHNLSDLLGFIVSLTAHQLSEGSTPAPPGYTFGWQRAKPVGAFFNAVFVLAIGTGILVQAIERFVHITPIENPKLVLIIGCVGLALNVLVLSFLNEHDHGHSHSHDHNNDKGNQTQSFEVDLEAQVLASGDNESSVFNSIASQREHKHKVASAAHSQKDLGMMGAFTHVVGDAINNVGVIVSALIIWRVEGEKRYYADPVIGVFIAIMIFFTAIPLLRKSLRILMQAAPEGTNIKDVQECIEKIPGVDSVRELRIWELHQKEPVTSARIVLKYDFNGKWHDTEKTITKWFHDYYGTHSVTLQPETAPKPTPPADSTAVGPEGLPIKKTEALHYQLQRNEVLQMNTLLRQSSG